MKKVFQTTYYTNVDVDVDVELDEEELNSAGWIYVGKGNTFSGESLRDAVEVWHNDSHEGAFRWCEHTVCREARI